MSPFDPRPGRPRIIGEPPTWVFNLILALGALGSLAIDAGVLTVAVVALGRL